MSDVLIVMNSGVPVRNTGVVTGVNNVGRYNRIQQGISQQVPVSGQPNMTTSGTFNATGNGVLGDRFHDAGATKVKFY